MKKVFSLIAILLFSFSLFACSGGQTGDQASGNKKGVVAKLVGGEIQVSAASDDQSNPRVVYLADKQLYFAVWEDWRDRNLTTTDFPADQTKFAGADIWGQFIAPDGTSCGSPFAVTNKLSGNQTAPSVAYRPGDKLVVAWQDTVGTSNGGYVRYASITTIPSPASCTTSLPIVSAPVQVGFTHFEQYNSNAVTANTTSFTIVGDGTGGSDVTGGAVLSPYVNPRSIRITGSYPAEDTVLATSGPSTPVNIQDDGQGKLIGSGASGNINYMTGNLDFTLINEVDTGATAVFTVTYGTLSGTQSSMTESLVSRQSPKINYDSVKDQFALAWVESRDVNTYASVLCFGVAPFTWVTGDSTFLGYLYLDPALAPKANPLAIVNPDIMRSERTSSMKLVSTARSATIETYVYDFFTNLNNPNLESDNTSPGTLFVWEGARNSATLTCTLDLATGTITSKFETAPKDDGKVHIYGIFDKELILNTVSKWIDFENTATGSNPSIAVDDASVPRKFLVAWEDMRGGSNTKIFGQLINSGGGLYNANRMLSFQDSAGTGTNDAVITNSRQTRPTISYDGVNQRYFVMWQDERNSSTSAANIDLYGQYVNLDGSLSGANYSVSSNSSNQLAPSIAYDSNLKQFLAVWKDARGVNSTPSTASDVYGQRFTIGQPQLTLLTATTPPAQLIPAVHDFGAVESGVWNFVVKNTGDTTLVVDKITQLPATPFTIAPTNAATLAPGSSATYTVKFTPTSSGTYNSSFTLTSDGGNQTVALSASGTISAPLSITTPTAAAWPNASASGAYSITLVAAGGFTPLTWSETGLPAGLSRTSTTDSTATYSGSNLPLGDYNIAVTVTDGSTPANTSTRNFTLKVGSAISIAVTPLSTWTQSIDYFTSPVHSLSSTGGTGTVTWLLLAGSGATPPGITLGNDGVFRGTATASGSYNFSVVATDTASQSSQAPFTITINPVPVITTSSLSTGVIGFAYNQQLDMTGGTTPIVWSQSGGLPPGLQFDAVKGAVSGTPTSAGSYDLTFLVTDAAGSVATKTFTLTVFPTFSIATPSTGLGSPPPAVVGTAYNNFTFKTNFGGTAPYSWTTISGATAGLTLNKDTGILSGTPTAPGDYTFTLKATDANGAFTTKTFVVSVLQTSLSVNVQLYGPTNSVVSSVSALQTTDLTGTPSGVNLSGAAQMQINGLASGETVNMAVSFVSIPSNPLFYSVNGSTWTQFTPDSIVGNTIFYKVKDRSSTTDTDPLALRDSNPVSGVIEGIVVVAAVGTPSPVSTAASTVGSVSSSGGGGGCFIATAAFGSYLDPHVMVLRHFRDDVLLQSELGTAFVKFYYKHSPPIADFIAQHETLRILMRFALTPLIFAVKYPLIAALLFAMAGAWFIRRRLSLKQQSVMVQQAG
jgi:hypothetical protein